MYGKAARIFLSEKQHEILQIIVKSTTASFRLIQRARFILLPFERVRNEEIATQVGLSRKQVGLWRRRWKQSFDALVSTECREPHAVLRRTIGDVLSDAPRAGAHGKLTAEQLTLIFSRIAASTDSTQPRKIPMFFKCRWRFVA